MAMTNPSFEDARDLPLYGSEELTDGDMETAGVAAWSVGNSASLSKVAGGPQGDQFLRVTYNAVSDPYAYQSVLTATKTYRVTGWVRGDLTGVPRIKLGTVSQDFSSSTTWQWVDFEATADGTDFALMAVISGAGRCDFDGISVREVTEPADVTSDGEPDGWDVYTEAAGWAWLDVSGRNRYVENYQARWDDNEDSIDDLTGSVAWLAFGTDLYQYDNYESEWSNNQNWIDELMPTWLTFDSSGEAHEDYEEEWQDQHYSADQTNYVTDTLIDSTPANVHARLNEIKADYNAHIASTTFHDSADTANQITSADATDLSSSTTLADEMWVDCWNHILDIVTYHRSKPTSMPTKPTMTSYPASTYDDCATIANYLTIYADLHFSWADCSGPGYLDEFNLTGVPLFGLLIQDYGPTGSKEDYEEEWKDNQNWDDDLDPGDLDAYDFDDGSGGNDPYDSYERTLSINIVLSGGSAGTERALSPTNPVRVSVTGSLNGDLRIQTRKEGSPTWTERGAVTTVPAYLDLGTGHEYVRIYTQTYTSGSPAASADWQPLT